MQKHIQTSKKRGVGIGEGDQCQNDVTLWTNLCSSYCLGYEK